MNENTLISVHCYGPTEGVRESWDLNPDGDVDLVRNLMPVHERHRAPIVILSPVDAPVPAMGPHICRSAGRRGYIGQGSFDRQIAQMKILLEYSFNYFLLNDSDSFCISAAIPRALFDASENTLWSNHVTEPRPHRSPYPKLACQPPYFCNRTVLSKLVKIAPRFKIHPITPFLDFAMLMWGCEAGVNHRAFTELEHPAKINFEGTDPWEILRFRIGHMGTTMCHPIKTVSQRDLCMGAREVYETENFPR